MNWRGWSLVNAGALWAGLAVVSGWLVRRPAPAVAAGVVALGLVGSIARRLDWWGMAARLVVPAGTVLEPFYLGRFATPAILPWPNRVAHVISGSALSTYAAVMPVNPAERPASASASQVPAKQSAGQ